jgi:hypothetical protein
MLQRLTVAVTWIAVKIEEQTPLVRLSELTLIFHILQQREEGHSNVIIENPEGEKFRELQAEIASKYEMGVFEALGFICHVDHPHKLAANLPGLIFYNADTKAPEVPEGLVQVRCLLRSGVSRRL